jgi:FO synthase subunit 1
MASVPVSHLEPKVTLFRGVVTYSPAYTLVPTYECFNRCTYCNFRQDLGQSPWLSLQQAEEKLRSLHPPEVIEILILSGEVHPQSPQRAAWFEHIYQLCELALSLEFLPHTNVGPLSFEEMERLKAVNVSMGLMLEQVTPELLKTVHRHAPSKIPNLRIQQLQWAGQLQIPFTTGLLLGIGETWDDRRQTLETIAQLHHQWGHIQEVIIQPYLLGSHQIDADQSFALADLPQVVAIACTILPDSITIQIPPNLIAEPEILLACLEAGARDLGGIGPKDEVNPDYPHLNPQVLADLLQPAGWQLVPRLPVYPRYYDSLSAKLQTALRFGG